MPSNEYWAGIFDGEGSISIMNGGKVQAAISQKRPEILYQAKEQFGGGVFSNQWKITDKIGIINFLSVIHPFSVVKKEEIELGLEAASLIRDQNKGCIPLSFDELQGRLDIRKRMQELRPKKLFRDSLSDRAIHRQTIKEVYGFRCISCGTDLEHVSAIYQIIRDGKLYCRACNCRMNSIEQKPLTKEQIENAILETENLDEACKILGVNRSSLYAKRKRLGLSLRTDKRGGGYRIKDVSVEKEKKALADKLYYRTHREKLIQKQKEYYERNRQKVLDYHKQLHQLTKGLAHPEEGGSAHSG